MNDPILIRRTKDPFGWMGNMSPFPVELDGKQYRTAEALFQCMRFEDDEIKEAIRAEKSPMSAKFVAKKYKDEMVVEPCSEHDLKNMRDCLNIKLHCNPELVQELLDTEDRLIIEDCTKRQRGSGLFWGAAKGDGWTGMTGKNWLGVLWMQIREQRRIMQNLCDQQEKSK